MPPQDQAQLAEDLATADDLALEAVIDLVLDCHATDQENDAIAERDTPVLED